MFYRGYLIAPTHCVQQILNVLVFFVRILVVKFIRTTATFDFMLAICKNGLKLMRWFPLPGAPNPGYKSWLPLLLKTENYYMWHVYPSHRSFWKGVIPCSAVTQSGSNLLNVSMTFEPWPLTKSNKAFQPNTPVMFQCTGQMDITTR